MGGEAMKYCVYCGARAHRSVQSVDICTAHSDIPKLDPHSLAVVQWVTVNAAQQPSEREAVSPAEGKAV